MEEKELQKEMEEAEDLLMERTKTNN